MLAKTRLLILIFSVFPLANANADAKIVVKRGGHVSVVKFENGAWQLQVDSSPYFIKGMIYTPVKIGEDPGEGTMRDWMEYDDDHNGKNDMAYETWLADDPKRKPVGDFELMKRMGLNTVRFYHVASNDPKLGDIYKVNSYISPQFDHPLNKPLLRELSEKYGIRVIMGNFVGSWTIGTGSTWDEGTDYTNPEHRGAIKKSVRAMVMDSKDEPYLLMWLLGNENNTADFSRCNAKSQPEAYAKFIGELTDMIHKLDPNHPVAICDGDDNFRMLRYYAKFAPTIDIIGYNAYRGQWGFGNIWMGAKALLDRPVMITEYGAFAYVQPKGEDEDYQLRYIQNCWKDIVLQSAFNYDSQKNRAGNSIGGIVFEWADRWYLSGTPREHNPGTKSHWNSPDHLFHEEYFGIVAMDSGQKGDSLLRRPRKVYSYFKDVWNKKGVPAY